MNALINLAKNNVIIILAQSILFLPIIFTLSVLFEMFTGFSSFIYELSYNSKREFLVTFFFSWLESAIFIGIYATLVYVGTLYCFTVVGKRVPGPVQWSALVSGGVFSIYFYHDNYVYMIICTAAYLLATIIGQVLRSIMGYKF